MSVGMKVAVGFLVLTGVLVLSGMAMTLSQIMQRLNSADQDNVVTSAPVQPTVPTAAAPDTAPQATPAPVIGQTNADRLILPKDATVQQIAPYGSSIYLLLVVPHEGQRIVILDTRTGTVRRVIRLDNSGR